MQISDFGLSRKLENKDYYRSKNGGLFPLRWTAPELLSKIANSPLPVMSGATESYSMKFGHWLLNLMEISTMIR